MITKKTPEEIAVLRKGGKILAAILDELETLVVPGGSTLDIDDRAMELMEQYGIEPITLGYAPSFAPRPYPAATSVSVNDVVVHGIPNEEPETFAEGDVVSVDVVAGYEGFVVDSARTVIAGEGSNEAQELVAVTKAALKAGIKAAVAGNRVKDISAAVEAAIPKKFGIVRDFCGHGVGYSLHEEPQIPNFVQKGDSPVLEAGMVLAIEPMVTLGSHEVYIDSGDGYTAFTQDGSLAAHMEHTVVVGEKQAEVLTVK